ncbi:ankyrin and armadillo repeat-containing protein-like isoform X2 [Polyodon spathula]|uniref:ankyrin and armadillo repeat-containing protein-like isoform X2 n=1 Tax=Polyodon spathula TaxID=7913 RepID=UPI001B7F2759|nr:ankyrin and armadillo repeat-containing protein-like isoform X2 [Polyodon spathula]
MLSVGEAAAYRPGSDQRVGTEPAGPVQRHGGCQRSPATRPPAALREGGNRPGGCPGAAAPLPGGVLHPTSWVPEVGGRLARDELPGGSHSELLQGEVACTLAAVVLGNSETAELLHSHPDFSYGHVLRLLYSIQSEVRLLAGIAIATFAFNSITRQRAIAESGGVRWHNFQPFLLCADPHYQLNAAFQCVVLSRIIPDKQPASACALAIQTIVGTLEHSQSKPILALAADCVGRLARTRAGIPAAIVSIDTVSLLCGLLSSSGEQVQGSAAIALGYLSFNHQADRQLLKRCREEPQLARTLLYYTHTHRLSPTFLEGWRHLRELGLPPIREKASLTSHPGQIKYFSKCISHQPVHTHMSCSAGQELQRAAWTDSPDSPQTHSAWTTRRLSETSRHIRGVTTLFRTPDHSATGHGKKTPIA